MATDRQNLLNEIQSKLGEFFRSGPVGDIERNVKAVVSQGFQRLDLVTREDFDIQADLIEQLRLRVADLERVVARLEEGRGPDGD